METQSINFIDTEYTDQLSELLRDKVFHVTTSRAGRKILKDRFIYANQDEKYPLNAGSFKSFGRYRGWVCLFDLRGKSNEVIDDALTRYNFLGPSWFKQYFENYTESRLVYFLMSETSYDHLLPNRKGRKSWDDDSGYTQYIPDVECWFPGKMPVELIEKAIWVREVMGSALDRGQQQTKRRIRSIAPLSNPADVLQPPLISVLCSEKR